MEALARGYLARYTTLDDLVRGLRRADALSKLSNKLAQLQRPHLLIIDEAGYVPLESADANRIFQVVNRRDTRGSTIVSSNKTVSEWADTFGDEALAAAILDRPAAASRCQAHLKNVGRSPFPLGGRWPGWWLVEGGSGSISLGSSRTGALSGDLRACEEWPRVIGPLFIRRPRRRERRAGMPRGVPSACSSGR
jgi:IstB-like ATP binding protein